MNFSLCSILLGKDIKRLKGHTIYTVFITGASSGLGRALALTYAQDKVRLLLTARNQERLDEVKELCEQKGAEVITKVIDVCDQKAMETWIVQMDEAYRIDLVIANAGISTQGKRETADSVKQLIDTNIQGVMNTVLPMIEPLIRRGKGQIALMSSLASFRGYAGRGMYSGSKAAVRLYGEGLRDFLAPKGVHVSVVCPGFVVTPMTATNTFHMPFLLQPERAAMIIKSGLKRNKPRIAFPIPLYCFAWLMGVLPPTISEWIARMMPLDKSEKE